MTRLSLHILISFSWVRCLISVNHHGLVQAERHLEAMLIYMWQEFDAWVSNDLLQYTPPKEILKRNKVDSWLYKWDLTEQ